MTPRLYLPQPLQVDARVALDADQTHYLNQVLRLSTGDELQVFDGKGARHRARISELRKHQAALTIGEALPANRLGAPRITLVQGIATADKMDWAIEKATELGAARIVPLQAQRAKVRLDATLAARRHAHWQRLIIAACMQCGRDELVELAPVCGWSELADWIDDGTHRLVLAPPAADDLPGESSIDSPSDSSRPPPQETSMPLARWARAHPLAQSITLLVGPESGLDDDERRLAQREGYQPISLGPRVLRTETAGLAAIAALQALMLG